MILFGGLAFAGALVLHDGTDATAAMRTVTRSVGVPSSSLRAATLPDLFTGAPELLTIDTLESYACQGAPRPWAEVEVREGRSELLVLNQDYDRAYAELRDALAAVDCLGDPVPREAAARAYFLQGVVSFEAGREGSVDAFRLARAMDPALVWDQNFRAAQGLTLYNSAAPELSTPSRLYVLAGRPELEVYVDGRLTGAPELSLSGGPHLVQVERESSFATARIAVPAGGDAVVVATRTLAPQNLAWLDADSTQRALGIVVHDTIAEEQQVFAVWGDALYSLDRTTKQWNELRIRPVSRRASLGMMAGSVGVGLLGGLVVGYGSLQWQDDLQRSNTPTEYQVDYETAYDDLKRSRALTLSALAVAGAGLTTGITIWVMDPDAPLRRSGEAP